MFDLNNNTLGNYAFVSALSALAQHQQYIDNLFNTKYTKEEHGKGVFSLKFVIDGDPQDIIIDDFVVSTSAAHAYPAFTKGKLWVVLVEKAWAKVHTTYVDSIRGEVHEILRDLTGAPSYSFDIKDAP